MITIPKGPLGNAAQQLLDSPPSLSAKALQAGTGLHFEALAHLLTSDSLTDKERELISQAIVTLTGGNRDALRIIMTQPLAAQLVMRATEETRTHIHNLQALGEEEGHFDQYM